MNMIPTSTGAAVAVGEVLPDLKGKLEAAGASAYSTVVQLRLKIGEFYKPANGAWVRK